jgi:hypothetical protein
MTYCLFRSGFRSSFLACTRRVVAGALNDVQFHNLVFQQTQGPLRASVRRRRADQGDQFGLDRAVEDSPPRRVRGMFAGKPPSNPSSTSGWRVRKRLPRWLSRAFTMRLSLQPSPASETSAFSRIRLQHLSGGMLALADQRFKRLPLLHARSNDVFLDRDFRYIPIPGNIEYRCQIITEPLRNQGRGALAIGVC